MWYHNTVCGFHATIPPHVVKVHAADLGSQKERQDSECQDAEYKPEQYTCPTDTRTNVQGLSATSKSSLHALNVHK